MTKAQTATTTELRPCAFCGAEVLDEACPLQPLSCAQTATVSDEAVQAALNTWYGNSDYRDFTNMRNALAAALPHLALSSAPCSVEVNKLEWLAHNEGFGEGRTYYGKGVLGHWYGVERTKNKVWECYHHIGKGGATYLPTTQSIEEAKAAAQSDYDRRILSQIVTKPVDVAAVRKHALEEACSVIDEYSEYDQSLCCSGHECGCQGASVHQAMQNYISALSPAEPAPNLVKAVIELKMTAFKDALPIRDELRHEQTILTYSENVGTWALEFFESGEDFPDRWIGGSHWIDISEMWAGVTAQVTQFCSPTEQAQGEQWQDIATAPKDGTEQHTWNGRRHHVAKFDKVENTWVSSFTTVTKRLPISPQPSHWMLLPAAPLSAGRTTEGGEV